MIIVWTVLTALVLPPLLGHAGPGHLNSLRSKIESSQSQLLSGSLSTASLLDQIRDIEDSFLEIPQASKKDLQALWELKTQLSTWRSLTQHNLFERLDNALYDEFQLIIQGLRRLRKTFSPKQIQRLASFGIDATFYTPNAVQISPLQSTSWSLDRWSGYEEFEFSSYVKGQGNYSVQVGSVEVQSGDLLLSNLNDPLEALGEVSGKMNYLSQVGLVVFVEKNGKTYPSVLEFTEGRLRAIPLKLYLSHEYSLYTEVYRFKTQTPESSLLSDNARSSEIALELLENGVQVGGTKSTTSLTSLVHALFERFGIQSISLDSPIDWSSPPTLAKLSQNSLPQASITDRSIVGELIRDSRLENVDSVDNNHQFELVFQEALAKYLELKMKGGILDPKALPKTARARQWMLDQMRRGGFVGSGLLFLSGYTAQSLPSGPSELFAFEEALRGEIARTQSEIYPEFVRLLEESLNSSQFDFNQFIESKRVRSLFEVKMPRIAQWFPSDRVTCTFQFEKKPTKARVQTLSYRNLKYRLSQ